LRIKKYTVDNVLEGMQQIKNELGPDAVIIQSRKVRQKGLRGLFVQPKIEITAAVDSVVVPAPPVAEDGIEQKLQEEVGELKQLVKKLVASQQKQHIEGKGPFAYWMQRLIDNDVEPGLAQEILAEIHENFAAENGLADEVVKMIVKNKVRDRLLTEDLPLRSRILAFVGPTGVGKTTTLAKLAAHFSLYRNQRTGIITIDTYRIGAVEQLRTYADITGIPIEVVMTPKEMPEALERLADREVILVDTAGRNAKNTLHVSELAAFLAPLSAPEIFLVLSASTKANDMRLIIDSFRKVKYNRLIFTKMDETATYGVILNACRQAELPVTYVTTGQNVPDDLEVADAEKIANLILGG